MDGQETRRLVRAALLATDEIVEYTFEPTGSDGEWQYEALAHGGSIIGRYPFTEFAGTALRIRVQDKGDGSRSRLDVETKNGRRSQGPGADTSVARAFLSNFDEFSELDDEALWAELEGAKPKQVAKGNRGIRQRMRLAVVAMVSFLTVLFWLAFTYVSGITPEGYPPLVELAVVASWLASTGFVLWYVWG